MKQYRLSDKDKLRLCELWETDNYTCVSLSKIFNISDVAIQGLLKRRGYTMKSQTVLQRKYHIDEHFFDIIDTEVKAYFLGILYADGYNNTTRNAVSLSLEESDKEILEKLSYHLQPTKPLQYIVFAKSKNQYRMVIANKRISNKLNEFGCGNNKTFKITYPLWLSEKLNRHFIRGYFDGDGCITVGINPCFSVIGTIPFLTVLQNILIKELGLNLTKMDNRHKDRNNNIRSMRYVGINSCKKIYTFLYKNTTISMKRKKYKYEAMLRQREELSCA